MQTSSAALAELAAFNKNQAITVGELLDFLQGRAFGLMLIVLAIPCCIPFLYGVPQVLSLPMLFVTAQLALGRNVIWLPNALRKRKLSAGSLAQIHARSQKLLGLLEHVTHPRFSWIGEKPFHYVIGLLLVLFSCSIAVPLPGTNTIPGFAVLLVAFGLVERDGLLVLAGSIIGTAWVSALMLIGKEAISVLVRAVM